ncbi:DUF2092 domain-containing protein [Pseudactinotalea sp. HY158]|uniref:LolA family protein n=1 Tax=Pseudactinotalea sp. HY158 TaxID=2654547 RepID=UPI00129C4F05|nr:DUF2092 domain-containing protein [Pseudactinotalea sp. HY158]QGH69730.1 DUF2092 domain-containing protein [Pseudactinotalea sp. HY158]
MAHSIRRWAPAGAVALVVAASGAWADAGSGIATQNLPERDAGEVLALLAGHDHEQFSASFETTSDLGLPALPTNIPGTDSGALSALSALTGDHEGRVFVGEKGQARVQVFEDFGERDLITNGTEAWYFDSGDNSVVHVSAPSGAGHADENSGTPGTQALQVTPEALAARVLAAVDPSTQVSVDGTGSVAGRAAYNLVLTPRTADTLVGRVAVAVDGDTGIPLRVAITPRGADRPALEAAFTSFDLGAPDAGLFSFTPPAGATVTEQELPALPDGHGVADGHGRGDMHATGDAPGAARPTVVGDGWAAVLELPAGTVGSDAFAAGGLADQLTTKVDGGRALETSLATILFTDDGRVLLGAVPLDRLQAAE